MKEMYKWVLFLMVVAAVVMIIYSPEIACEYGNKEETIASCLYMRWAIGIATGVFMLFILYIESRDREEWICKQ